MRLRNIPIFIILWLSVISILAQKSTDPVPLEARRIWVGDGQVEFELWNVSDQPITAWDINVTATVDGDFKTIRRGGDNYISTKSQPYTSRSPEGGHRSGALQVNDFHYFRFPISGISESSAQSVAVIVNCAIFEDTSFWGDSQVADEFFNNRRAQLNAFGYILIELDEIQKDPEVTDKIEAYISRLNREFGNPPPQSQVRVMNEREATRVGFLSTVESMKYSLDYGLISDDEAISALVKIATKYRDSARKHSPKRVRGN